jgi:hypothetical protein
VSLPDDLAMAYEAAIAVQADLERQEQEAIDRGDAATAADRRGERLLLGQAIKKAQRVLAAPRPRRQDRPTGPEWVAIVRAYRILATKHPGERPSQADVAGQLRISERTLVTRLRALDVKPWHAVHALVASEP